MCGINGIHAYHYAANPIDRAELVRTRDRMAARGPDGAGAWVSADERIGLGHRRLAIIDPTAAAAQPMASADARLVVTFNGEIYNHRELRSRLEARGARFRTASDTEVLLHLYAEQGAGLVHELRGMFAFAIWDDRQRTLLLARDPYGIKPLYYSDDGWTCRFASQVKALLAGGAVSREPDPAGAVGFYLLGSVPEPFTTTRAIRAVPAGTTVIVDRTGAHAARRYHSIAGAYAGTRRAGLPPARAREEITQALRDSVLSHLVSDVPVGAFLSSGIDSTALVGLMRDCGAGDIQTVTIGFEEFRNRPEDETRLAAEAARAYGTRHTTRIVTRAELEADLPRILEAMDQPTIDGVNTWLVAKAARELGLKVAISGLGGDELLGGYPSFRDVPRWVRILALPARVPGLGALARRLVSPLTEALGANPKAAGLLEYGGTWAGAWLLRRGLFLPWELDRVLDRDTIEQGMRRLRPLHMIRSVLEPMPGDAHARVATLEAALYMRNQLLRDTDWASMAHSLEVRVPLVDSALLAALAGHTAALQAGAGKSLLASAPSQPVPDAIASRAKTGFTTPIDTWMQDIAQQAPRATPWARTWSRVVGPAMAEPASPAGALQHAAATAPGVTALTTR